MNIRVQLRGSRVGLRASDYKKYCSVKNATQHEKPHTLYLLLFCLIPTVLISFWHKHANSRNVDDFGPHVKVRRNLSSIKLFLSICPQRQEFHYLIPKLQFQVVYEFFNFGYILSIKNIYYDFSKKHLIAYICLYCLYVYAIKMNKNS